MSKRLRRIICCKDKTSLWHLNGFPDGSEIGSTVFIHVVSHIQHMGCQPEKPTLHGGQSRSETKIDAFSYTVP